jgi:hypothetical protein
MVRIGQLSGARNHANSLRDYFGTFTQFLRECFRPVPLCGAGLAPEWGGNYL